MCDGFGKRRACLELRKMVDPGSVHRSTDAKSCGWRPRLFNICVPTVVNAKRTSTSVVPWISAYGAHRHGSLSQNSGVKPARARGDAHLVLSSIFAFAAWNPFTAVQLVRQSVKGRKISFLCFEACCVQTCLSWFLLKWLCDFAHVSHQFGLTFPVAAFPTASCVSSNTIPVRLPGMASLLLTPLVIICFQSARVAACLVLSWACSLHIISVSQHICIQFRVVGCLRHSLAYKSVAKVSSHPGGRGLAKTLSRQSVNRV